MTKPTARNIQIRIIMTDSMNRRMKPNITFITTAPPGTAITIITQAGDFIQAGIHPIIPPVLSAIPHIRITAGMTEVIIHRLKERRVPLIKAGKTESCRRKKERPDHRGAVIRRIIPRNLPISHPVISLPLNQETAAAQKIFHHQDQTKIKVM